MKTITKMTDKTIICGSCDTVYEYDYSDLKPVGINAVLVVCPNCGQELVLFGETKLKDKVVQVFVEDDQCKK